jgi:SAM-dependent methyltransferase
LDCEFVYLDPIPDFARFDLWDQVYRVASPDTSLALRCWSYAMRGWNRIFDRTPSLHDLPSGDGRLASGRRTILDVGCANGARLLSFARRRWDVWGIDMSEESIAAARTRLPGGHLFHGDFLSFALPESSFDAIRGDAVWEHVEDPVAFVRKCHRLLRPGGQLILYVPNYRSGLQRLFGRYNVNSWVPFHINFFTNATARRALLMGGFSHCTIRTNSHSGYLPLTVRQFLNRHHSSFSTEDLGWLSTLYFVYSPAKLVLDALGLGEELIITACMSA